MNNDLIDIWRKNIVSLNKDLYNYKTTKQIPHEWVEEKIILTPEVSRFSGRFSYDLSPYAKEMIDSLHPSDPTRIVAVMKGAQSGITQGLVVPGMAWIISENPDNFLFTASDKEIAKLTIDTRFDPVIQSSGLSHLIRSNVIRAKGQRTGDTSFSKEFAGGSAIIEGTNNAGKFRFFSVRFVFMDDFDNAPRADKKEGSTRKLVEGRQTSYGNLAKTYYVSTPTITQTSNIYEVYLLGDQRKWHWPCPSCDEWMPAEWQIKLEGGGYAGIVWELDENKELIEESVAFRCPHCLNTITNNEKHELNILGKWIPTAKPENKYYRSYHMNSLIIPPGFIGWVDLVREWLKANPVGGRADVDLLKVFNNVRLGLPFEEKGEVPRIMKLMENIRDYKAGIVPDKLCKEDGNGDIVLITLSADLGGVMNDDLEDVRIDWAIVGHSTTGATYSIDQGSCGTFKRKRRKSKKDIENDHLRKKWTYMHGMGNSVWPLLDKIIKSDLKSQSGDLYKIKLSLIDTGHFTKQAYQFVRDFHTSDNWIFGIKGVPEINYRRNSRDVALVKKSVNKANLYLLDVEQLKDKLAANMRLRATEDGGQEDGFMNFPQQGDGKYELRTFFKHYESEARKELIENKEVVGFKWQKKNSDVENHFWDVQVYNDAARYIFLDLIKRSDPSKLKDLTWGTFVELILGS